ncbi:hypothetical protein DPEC_G00312120 [Dallia pectoralis]|uniref:Uncharacterized protein n=1 Tax=Dallia pectoralis TaxID=75939 RepID=A0ACC2FBG4_DALPE|nr:hypothetical protein DPEC_G00312120 [Dallia pectoralis]
MSKLQSFRAFLNERLTVAALEIFEAVEKTVVEYEEEIERLQRLQRITPVIKQRKKDSQLFSLIVPEGEVPPEEQHSEQEWSPSLVEEDPETTQIKQEQEELRISQEEEQLQEIFTTKHTIFTPPCVKKEIEGLQRLQRITPVIKQRKKDSQLFSLIVSEGEVPPEEQHSEQEWSPSLVEEEPETTQIKQEQEELRTSQEEEQLQEIFTTKHSIFTPPCVKKEIERLQRLQRITPVIKQRKRDSQLFSLIVSEGEVPPEEQHSEQEWSPSLVEEEPETTQIKQEQEELRTSQEEEQLQEIFTTKHSIFTPPCVKKEIERLQRLQRITPVIKQRKKDSQLFSLIVSEGEVPPEEQHSEQEWSPSLVEEEPETTQIKQEQEESFRAFLNERLTVAALEIFEAVEKTVVEYEEEIERLQRLQRITPVIKQRKKDSQLFSLIVSEGEVPPEEQHSEQEWSPSLVEEEPETTQIKQEQEELRTSQEEEQLQEIFTTKHSIFTPPCVKKFQQFSLPVSEEVSQEEQEWIACLVEEDPETTQIKQEQEEEQLHELFNNKQSIFTPRCVKSECSHEDPLWSLTFPQTQTVENRE